MKSLTIALTCLAVTLGYAQDLSKKVTYKTVAVPVQRAVAEIAAISGTRLEVADAASRNILVISVKDVPLSELLDRIATAISGEWTTDAEGIRRLNYSTAQIRKEEAAEHEARAKKIANALAELRKKLDEKPKPQDPNAKLNEMERAQMFFGQMATMTPTNRAIILIASRLDPGLLASMKKGDRVVFATTPTPMQRPLGNISAVIQDLIVANNQKAEEAALAKKAQQEGGIPKTVEQERTERQMRETFGAMFGDTLQEPKVINEPPAKVLLIATTGGGFPFMGLGNEITVQLKLFNANGEVVLRGSQSLNLDTSFVDLMAASAQEPKPETGKPIKFSALTQEFNSLSRVNMMAGFGPDRRPSAELAKQLTQPDKYDPLSYAPSEALHAVAETKNLNVVANLPDYLVGMAETFSRGTGGTVESFLSGLETGGNVEIKTEGAWMTIRPSRPAEARAGRLDRSALAALISAAEKKLVPTLDDFAAYALKNEAPMETPVALPYIMLFAPNAMSQGMRGMTNWTMLRLYGSLTQGQREALRSGARVSVVSLLPGQRALVEKMAFGSESKLKVERDGERPRGEMGFMELIQQFMPQPARDFRDEPTEIMPNGIPQQAYITAAVSNETVAMIARSDNSAVRMFGALGADEIAMLKFVSTFPGAEEAAAMMPKFDSLLLGSREVWDFTFTVAPRVTMQESLQNDAVAQGSPVAYESAPTSFQERVARRLEVFKRTTPPFMRGGG